MQKVFIGGVPLVQFKSSSTNLQSSHLIMSFLALFGSAGKVMKNAVGGKDALYLIINADFCINHLYVKLGNSVANHDSNKHV